MFNLKGFTTDHNIDSDQSLPLCLLDVFSFKWLDKICSEVCFDFSLVCQLHLCLIVQQFCSCLFP